MTCRCALLAVILSSLAVCGCAAAVADRSVAVAGAVAPSVVRVQITLRYDKGEEPEAGQGGTRYFPDLVREERPFELRGFVVSPTQVVAPDPMIHPRFVEAVAVRQGDDVVKARLAAYAVARNLMVLELERPLKVARPLVFDGRRSPPFFAVWAFTEDGVWTLKAASLSVDANVDADGRRWFSSAAARSLVTDESGKAVGIPMDNELPDDGSWMGSPLDQPLITADQMAARLAALQAHLGQTFARVTLHFRSPPNKERGSGFRSSRDEDDENTTEQNAVGVLLEGGKVLILANLRPKVTARLERIDVHPVQGEAVTARFAASLADYGALLATLDKPLGKPAPLATAPIRANRLVALGAAEIRLHGEGWTLYLEHRRISGFDLGWREHVYPEVPRKEKDIFLFDDAMRLVALPIARREKSSQDRSSSRDKKLTAAADLAVVLADVAKNADTHNVPLSEESQSRLAWLGVELQALNRELARANKVADLTKDGETGGLVSYVYPDSPAAKAGVEAGWILLRLQAEGEPKPIEVKVRDEPDRGPFPWDRLDELPEQYYDRIPAPWPNVENFLTRTLTDLGYGTKFKAEFFRDGKAVTKDFEVVQGPPHYEAAPRYKSQTLGITVRDITYELRRYLQKKDDEPGVVISKVEPGSKASVAGIKPFEVITHVNDKPVMNVKDFEAATAKQDELKVSVKRMTRGRVVKIKMGGAAAAPAQPPAGEPPAGAEKPPAEEKPAADTPPAAESSPKKDPKPRAEDKPVP